MFATTKAATTYPKAILEVCSCNIQKYPQIKDFINGNYPKNHSNLSTHYVRAQDPVIKLLDSGGNVKKTVSIKKWDKATIEEYLDENMKRSGGRPHRV